MKTLDTGGMAFPRTRQQTDTYIQRGMTLRMWLAGQALSGAIVNCYQTISDSDIETLARAALTVADDVIRLDREDHEKFNQGG